MSRLQTIFNSELETFDSIVECKLVDSAAGETTPGFLDGYASTFNGEADTHGDVVAPGVFAASLARHAKAGTMPALLWAHDPAHPIGRVTKAVEDAVGLRIQGQLNLDTHAGQQAYAHVKNSGVRGLSIGFRNTHRVPHANGSRRIVSTDVDEISLTPLPSNDRARIKEVKHIGSRDELEAILREAGLPRSAARKVAAGGYGALAGSAAATEPDPDYTPLIERMRRATGEIKSWKGNPR